MPVTATEFKLNLGRYLALAMTQDIFISKNGKCIASLTTPKVDKISILDNLVGIIPSDENTDEDVLKEERLARQ